MLYDGVNSIYDDWYYSIDDVLYCVYLFDRLYIDLCKTHFVTQNRKVAYAAVQSQKVVFAYITSDNDSVTAFWLCRAVRVSIAVKSQKTKTVYIPSKQLLFFSFAGQNKPISLWLMMWTNLFKPFVMGDVKHIFLCAGTKPFFKNNGGKVVNDDETSLLHNTSHNIGYVCLEKKTVYVSLLLDSLSCSLFKCCLLQWS